MMLRVVCLPSVDHNGLWCETKALFVCCSALECLLNASDVNALSASELLLCPALKLHWVIKLVIFPFRSIILSPAVNMKSFFKGSLKELTKNSLKNFKGAQNHFTHFRLSFRPRHEYFWQKLCTVTWDEYSSHISSLKIKQYIKNKLLYSK